jgi:hypothetical protein
MVSEKTCTIFGAIKPLSLGNNIYFRIKVFSLCTLRSNGYKRCLTSVPTLQRTTHWLPTLIYALHCTLATPKNATHTKSVGKGASNAYMDV